MDEFRADGTMAARSRRDAGIVVAGAHAHPVEGERRHEAINGCNDVADVAPAADGRLRGGPGPGAAGRPGPVTPPVTAAAPATVRRRDGEVLDDGTVVVIAQTSDGPLAVNTLLPARSTFRPAEVLNAAAPTPPPPPASPAAPLARGGATERSLRIADRRGPRLRVSPDDHAARPAARRPSDHRHARRARVRRGTAGGRLRLRIAATDPAATARRSPAR